MKATSPLSKKQIITLILLIILNVLLTLFYLFIYYGILDVYTFSLDSPSAQLSANGDMYIIGSFVLDAVKI